MASIMPYYNDSAIYGVALQFVILFGSEVRIA